MHSRSHSWGFAAWRLLACVLCCLTLLGQARAQADATEPADPILRSAYWLDPTGQASFDEARAQSYTSYEGVLNRGYTDGVHWIRLSLAPSPGGLGLRINPAWLDEVTLFDPAQVGPPLSVGDRYSSDLNAFYGLGFSFELPPSEVAREVWLRLSTTSAHRMEVEALPVSEMFDASTRAIAWAAIYGAVLILMLLVLLVPWLVRPDRILGAFLLRHVSFICFGTGYLGLPTLLWHETLPPEFFDVAFSVAVTASLPFGLFFDVALLSAYNPNKHLLRVLKLLAGLGVGIVLLVLLGHERLALEMNVQAMSLAVLLVFAAALSSRPDPSVEQLMPKKVMVGYYTLVLGGLLIGLVSVLGWTQPRGWAMTNVLILHGLVSALVMTAILFVRGQRQLTHSEHVAWQLREAQQEVEAEQRRSREQSQFLHMLMHELKTPLSIVSMALGTRDNKEHNLQLAGRAVQDMKAVIERCVMADRLGQGAIEPHLAPVDLSDELRLLLKQMTGLADRLQASLAEGVVVQTDRQLLLTILNNLMDNAARYGDAVSPVTVDLQRAHRQGQEGVLLRIANTPGLAGWPDPSAIFTKYYRASGAQRDSGSGLGLFLSRQLAGSLRGSLTYQPTDTLVQFELWIPLTPH